MCKRKLESFEGLIYALKFECCILESDINLGMRVENVLDDLYWVLIGVFGGKMSEERDDTLEK